MIALRVLLAGAWPANTASLALLVTLRKLYTIDISGASSDGRRGGVRAQCSPEKKCQLAGLGEQEQLLQKPCTPTVTHDHGEEGMP